MTFCDILDKHDIGINVGLGIRNAGGNDGVLFSAAELLLSGIDKVLSVVKSLSGNDGSMREFTAAMHGIKGSLLNIGAVRLAARAAKLEESARNRDYNYCAENSNGFLSEISIFIERLTAAVNEYKAISETKTHTFESADKAAFTAGVEKLGKALDDFDIDSAEECLNELYAVSAETEKTLCEIKNFVKRYDFEAAIEKTNELINRIK